MSGERPTQNAVMGDNIAWQGAREIKVTSHEQIVHNELVRHFFRVNVILRTLSTSSHTTVNTQEAVIENCRQR